MGEKRFVQTDLFALIYPKAELPKHIRLIEFFAGIGAQAKALESLGADFEHWRTCEWSIHSIIAYNAIHIHDFSDHSQGMPYDDVVKALSGVSSDYNRPMTEAEIRRRGEKWARRIYSSMVAIKDEKPDISTLKGSDLGIVDKENNTYVMTYSFPCQDLSNAGLMKGMAKGGGTRSGLLWEVERILGELKEDGALPQVLVMENVPGVCGSANLGPWHDWLMRLEELGYTNYFKMLNAKDFAIPQNRVRCFMVSIQGAASFNFPVPMSELHPLADFMDQNVAESYYLPEELIEGFVPKGEEKEGEIPLDGDEPTLFGEVPV